VVSVQLTNLKSSRNACGQLRRILRDGSGGCQRPAGIKSVEVYYWDVPPASGSPFQKTSHSTKNATLPRYLSALILSCGRDHNFPSADDKCPSGDVPTGKADSHAVTQERLTWSPAQLQFGEVAVGQTKNAFVTITNRGRSSLTVSKATSTGAEFSLSGLELPLSLSGGESFTFTVTFAPQRRGVANGSISVVCGTSKKTLTMRLEGTTAENTPTRETPTSNMPPLVQHKVKLSWKASTSKHVIGYNIYRANRSGGPIQEDQ